MVSRSTIVLICGLAVVAGFGGLLVRNAIVHEQKAGQLSRPDKRRSWEETQRAMLYQGENPCDMALISAEELEEQLLYRVSPGVSSFGAKITPAVTAQVQEVLAKQEQLLNQGKCDELAGYIEKVRSSFVPFEELKQAEGERAKGNNECRMELINEDEMSNQCMSDDDAETNRCIEEVMFKQDQLIRESKCKELAGYIRKVRSRFGVVRTSVPTVRPENMR